MAELTPDGYRIVPRLPDSQWGAPVEKGKRALLLATDAAQLVAVIIGCLVIALLALFVLLPMYWWESVKERASAGAEGTG